VVITTCSPLWEAIGEAAGSEKNGKQQRLGIKPEPPANGNTNKQSNRKLSPKGKTNQPQGEAKMELGYQP